MSENDTLSQLVTGTGSSSTSRQQSRSITVDKPAEGAVDLILDFLSSDDTGGEIEVFAFAEDAEDNDKVIPDSLKEEYDLPDDMNTMSWEDLFGLDLQDYEYVSYPPRNRGEDESGYQEEYDLSNFTGDITGDTKKVLNGYYTEKIQDVLAEDDNADEDSPQIEIAVRAGIKSEHSDEGEDEYLAARKYQRFYIRSTSKTPERVLKARQQVGEITESEKEKLLDDNQTDEE